MGIRPVRHARMISSAIAARDARMASRSKQRSLPGLDQDDPRSSPEDEISATEVMVSTADSRTDRAGGDAPARPANPKPCDRQPQPVDIKGWNVYVVDAHSLIFQVFHALPEMSSPRGEQVGAVFGFVRDMLYLIEEKKPDALICAFDLSGPTFRNELYDAYKAERGEMPDELVGQIPKIERVLEAMAIPVLTCEGFEADDVLATVARICDEAGANCFIVTGDKDCRQLITDRVAVYNIRKNQVFDAAALRAGLGRRARPGRRFSGARRRQGRQRAGRCRHRPQDGPAAARNLRHARQSAGARRRSARRERQEACSNRARSRCFRASWCGSIRNVPIVPDWDASRVGGMDHDALAELFAEFGFRTFAERVAKLAPSRRRAAASTAAEPRITSSSTRRPSWPSWWPSLRSSR